MKHSSPQANDVTTAGQRLRTLLTDGAAAFGLYLSSLQADLCLEYARLVWEARSRLNVSGATSLEQVVTKHVVDSFGCLQSRAVARARTIVDVGTGAGFPSAALAILRPEASVTALESRRRKAEFVQGATAHCGMPNLDVHCVRSEAAAASALRDSFEVAICRALAVPAVAVELCLPLVRPGGILVVLSGERDAESAGDLHRVSERVGGGCPQGSTYDLPVLGHRRGLIEIPKAFPTPPEFPRRAGMAAKRPLK